MTPVDDRDCSIKRDWLVVQLATDLLGFELKALRGQTSLSPQARPDGPTVDKRCGHGLRVALPALERLGLTLDSTADAPQVAAERLCTIVERRERPEERLALALSMLPVGVWHDEYMFIRVLQMFEATFGLLACDLSSAVDALAQDDAFAAARLVGHAEAILRESLPLWPLLATMRVESFHAFREYTEGASAIQSRNYKLMESLCRTPDRTRLDSPAYTSTPDVRERVLAGVTPLDDAVRRASDAGSLDPSGQAQLFDQMRAFAATLKRWRRTHHRLAQRMLGDQRTGTGSTAGVPYLAAVRDIEVFLAIPTERSLRGPV